MSSPNVLICGSGIAGSVFSFWLLRAFPAAAITIVERDPVLRLTGSSIDIRSSAIDIIKRMGAEKDIRAQTTSETGVEFVNAKGRPWATLRASGNTEFQSLTSEFEIFRGALAKIFIDRVRDRVNLVLDESVASYEERGDKVAVTFTKSKEVKTYDLVIGADGFGSRMRGMMLNASPYDHHFDEGVHIAYFTMKRDLLDGSSLAKYYNATGGRVVFLRPDPNPAGRTRVLLMNVTTTGDVAAKARLNDAVRAGNEAYMALMEEQFHDAGWLAPEVLRGMRESDDFYCSLFGQVRSPRLHGAGGRVVLLGDAGYATPGFGTSLAIAGSYVLAGELLRHGGDVGPAARAYEELLLPFVKASQGGDKAMQYMNPQSGLGIGIRNAVLGFVTGLRLDQLAMRGAVALGMKEKRIPMPEYEWPAE